MLEYYMQTEVGNIHCCKWVPKGEARGIIQIVHGISEYIARYDDFANYLSEAGYIVVGEDHPGHGNSVSDQDQFGYLNGGWMGTVKLIHQLYLRTKSEHPGLPYMMLGHSMGSFLVRTYLFTYHDELVGVLLSGTGWLPEVILPVGILICKEEAARNGEFQHSPLLQKLMFGSYNKTFTPTRTPYDWISSDQGVVDRYAEDPFCTWLPSIQLCREMMQGIQMNQNRNNLMRMQKELPVFFFAGQLDPVGDMGNGVLKCVQAFKNAGMKNVLVELYPQMRHECHNEYGKEKVYADVVGWVNQYCQ